MADISKLKVNSTVYNIKDVNALPLSGGDMTGTITAGNWLKTTNLKIAEKGYFVNLNATRSTSKGVVVDRYLPILRVMSTHGSFSNWILGRSYDVIYRSDNETANYTYKATLLDESGNAAFPNAVYASVFQGSLNGNASTATRSTTADSVSASSRATSVKIKDVTFPLENSISANSTEDDGSTSIRFLPVWKANSPSGTFSTWTVGDIVRLSYHARGNEANSPTKNIIDFESDGDVKVYGKIYGSLSGNATSATKATQLATARDIWGHSFDGTGNISGSINFNYTDYLRWNPDEAERPSFFMCGGNGGLDLGIVKKDDITLNPVLSVICLNITDSPYVKIYNKLDIVKLKSSNELYDLSIDFADNECVVDCNYPIHINSSDLVVSEILYVSEINGTGSGGIMSDGDVYANRAIGDFTLGKFDLPWAGLYTNAIHMQYGQGSDTGGNRISVDMSNFETLNVSVHSNVTDYNLIKIIPDFSNKYTFDSSSISIYSKVNLNGTLNASTIKSSDLTTGDIETHNVSLTGNPQASMFGYAVGRYHSKSETNPVDWIIGIHDGDKDVLSIFSTLDDEVCIIDTDTFTINATLLVDGTINSTGDVTAHSTVLTSDETLKNIIEDVNISVESIAKAPSVHFTWKESGEDAVGSIAQYWNDIIPLAVHTVNDHLGMQYDVIALLNTISIAKETVDLKSLIQQLQNKIAELESKLTISQYE